MERENFGSRIGFVLVSAGCAIGLGNVWKFPYVCGENGGAAFILIYLVFLALLGFPIMVSEFAVGRRSRKSVASSFKELEPPNTRWHHFGYFGMVANYLLMMFYTVVAAWMLYYCYRMSLGEFTRETLTNSEINTKYNEMLSSPSTMSLWLVIVIILSFGICAMGVQKGIEKVTKIMMTCLLVLILALVVNSVTLPGAREGIEFYLKPDFDAIMEIGIGKVIFAALSQSFFTLSIGMGSMAIFGSYMKKERTLAGETISISVLDTFVALSAGLIVIPACFAFQIEPDSGPSLVFLTLPKVFTNMASGRIWGTLFFLFLSFAALTTVVAVFENIVSFGIDLFGWSRKKTVIINIFALTILSLPCVFGFNILSDIQPLGPGTNIMDLEDFLVSNNVLPLGSLIYVMFCTSKRGWGWNNFIEEANQGKGIKFPQALKFYMTYILPVAIVAIYLKGYYDFFAPKGTTMLVGWMCFAVAMLALVFWFTRPKKMAEK